MRKKIYITCLHLNHGGVEMAITLLANALVKYNYEVEILCTYNFGSPVYPLNKEVKVRYLTDVLPNRESFTLPYIPKILLEYAQRVFMLLKRYI